MLQNTLVKRLRVRISQIYELPNNMIAQLQEKELFKAKKGK